MIEPSQSIDELARAVIGAAMEVHTVLGAGFLEAVYEQALAIELEQRGISFHRQFPIALTYKGTAIGEARLDFLIGGAFDC